MENNKETLVHYEGIVNQYFLDFIVLQLKEEKHIDSIQSKNKAIRSTIELVTNIISHSKTDEIATFELYKRGKLIYITTKNKSTKKNANLAKSRLELVKNTYNKEQLTLSTIQKSLLNKSSHLGILKLYQYSTGNFSISYKEDKINKLLISKCIINDSN